MRRRARIQRVVAVVACSGCLVAHTSQASSTPPAGDSSAGGGGGGWNNMASQLEDKHAPYTHTRAPAFGFDGVEYPKDSYQHASPHGQDTGGETAEMHQSYYPGQQTDTSTPAASMREKFYEQTNERQQHERYQPPPYSSQQSPWVGHHRTGPQQSPLQEQQGYYSRPGAASSASGHGNPLRLGTKWKSIVSRVKEAVSPGHNAGYVQSGYYAEVENSSGYPPGSTWVSGAQQHARYPQEGASYERPGGYNNYGQEQGYRRTYDPYAGQEGYGQVETEGAFYSTSDPTTYNEEHGSPGTNQRDRNSGNIPQGAPWQQQAQHSQSSQASPLYHSSNDRASGLEIYTDSDGFQTSRTVNVESISGTNTAHDRDGDGTWAGVSTGVQSSQGSQGAQVNHGLNGDNGIPYTKESAWGQDWAPATPAHLHAPPPRGQAEDDNQADEDGRFSTRTSTTMRPPSALGLSSQHEPQHVDRNSKFWGDTDPRQPSDVPRLSGNNVAPGEEWHARDDHEAASQRGGSDHASWTSGQQEVDGSPSIHVEVPQTPEQEATAPVAQHIIRDQEEEAEALIHVVMPETGAHALAKSDAHDAMQSSADHGLEKVDWGDEAEEELMEPSVIMDAFGEEGTEREEEVLIRELERMDAMGGSETDTASPPVDIGEETDEGVEHTLDVLFDSIRGDKEQEASISDDPLFFASDATAERKVRATEDARSPDSYRPEGNEDSSGHARDPEEDDIFHVLEEEDTETSEVVVALESSDGEVEGPTTSEGGKIEDSMWGNTRRWDSLPTRTVIISKTLGVNEDQDQAEDKEDIMGSDDSSSDDSSSDEQQTTPLDPIELPPSAASDEIWNDQHLQDQLDAYWEQTRRASGLAGSLSGMGQQQLARVGQDFQPTYGPGDWVGKGTQKTAIVQEPLPGADRGIIQSDLRVPNLFHGNQAPINIYGNIYVGHPEQRARDEMQASSSPEFGAREQYFSQGETHWSGSNRGGT